MYSPFEARFGSRFSSREAAKNAKEKAFIAFPRLRVRKILQRRNSDPFAFFVASREKCIHPKRRMHLRGAVCFACADEAVDSMQQTQSPKCRILENALIAALKQRIGAPGCGVKSDAVRHSHGRQVRIRFPLRLEAFLRHAVQLDVIAVEVFDDLKNFSLL